MENKARISPQTSSRRRCHPLSCYLLFGNWIGGERSYTVIMLPDSINFVFLLAWCKLPVVLTATALKPVQKKKNLNMMWWDVPFYPWCQPAAEDEKNISSKGHFESVVLDKVQKRERERYGRCFESIHYTAGNITRLISVLATQSYLE